MSALGQKQTCAAIKPNVRYGPIADIQKPSWKPPYRFALKGSAETACPSPPRVSLWSGLGARRSAGLRGEVCCDVGDILSAELDHIHNIARRARVLTPAVLECLQLRLDVCRPLRREIRDRIAHAHACCAVACRAHGGGQLFARFDIRGMCNLRNGQDNGQPKDFFHGSSPLVRSADVLPRTSSRMNDRI